MEADRARRDAGHGSLFSPLPEALARSLTPLLVDPPGFSRTQVPAVYERITAFFAEHLPATRSPGASRHARGLGPVS